MDFLESLLCLGFGVLFAAAAVGAVAFFRRERMTRLEQRVVVLEEKVRELRRDAARPAAPPRETAEPAAPPAVNVPAPPPPAPAPASELLTETAAAAERRAVADPFEAFLGGRVLLVVGVVVVLVGLGFFFRYAVERGWVDFAVRIAIGAACGSAALVAGHVLWRRGFAVFGQALMGCGFGALYLCDFFASKRYGMIGTTPAFAAAALLAAAMATFAVRRGAPFLVWLGFVGAFLAPWALGTNQDALEGLTGWLLVAELGVAGALVVRDFPGLDAFAALASVGYLAAWSDRWYQTSRAGAAAGCLAALVAAALVLCFVPAAIARRNGNGASVAGAALALLAALGVALHRFVPDHRTEVGVALVATALAVAGLGVLHRRRAEAARSHSEGVFALALAVLATSVPVLLRGPSIAPAWAALGAACVHAGARLRRPWLVTGGLLAILLGAARVLVLRAELLDRAPDVVFGADFAFAFAPFAALAAAAASLRRSDDAGPAAAVPLALAHAWLLLIVSIELFAWGRTGAGGADPADAGRRAQVALSAWWALYGAGLVAIGFWRAQAAYRWAGIGLLLLTVGKVFVVDLAELETVWRTVSFLALGALLVGASFLYQRLRPR